MNTIENIWYLPSKNKWKKTHSLAMKDIGALTIYPDGITFKGTYFSLAIKRVVGVSYCKQGRNLINNWVKLEYYNCDNELEKIYFADGNRRGWSGVFGGTKKIYKLLKNIYLEPQSQAYGNNTTASNIAPAHNG